MWIVSFLMMQYRCMPAVQNVLEFTNFVLVSIPPGIKLLFRHAGICFMLRGEVNLRRDGRVGERRYREM